MANNAEYNYNRVLEKIRDNYKKLKQTDAYKNLDWREREQIDEYFKNWHADVLNKERAIAEYYLTKEEAALEEERVKKGRAEREARRGSLLGNVENYTGDLARGFVEHTFNDPLKIATLGAQTVGLDNAAKAMANASHEYSDTLEDLFGRKAEWTTKENEWRPDSLESAVDAGLGTAIDMGTLIYNPVNAVIQGGALGAGATKAGQSVANKVLEKTGSKALSTIAGMGVNGLPTAVSMSLPELYGDQFDFDAHGNVILPKSVLPTYLLAPIHGAIEHLGVDPRKPFTQSIRKSFRKWLTDWAAGMPKRVLGEGTEEFLQDGLSMLDKRLSEDESVIQAFSNFAGELQVKYPNLVQSFILGGIGGALMPEDIGNIKSNKELTAQRQALAQQRNDILAMTNNVGITKTEADRANLINDIDKALQGYDMKIADNSVDMAERQRLAQEKQDEREQQQLLQEKQAQEQVTDLLNNYVYGMEQQNRIDNSNRSTFFDVPFVDENEYDYNTIYDNLMGEAIQQQLAENTERNKGKEQQYLQEWNTMPEEEQRQFADFNEYKGARMATDEETEYDRTSKGIEFAQEYANLKPEERAKYKDSNDYIIRRHNQEIQKLRKRGDITRSNRLLSAITSNRNKQDRQTKQQGRVKAYKQTAINAREQRRKTVAENEAKRKDIIEQLKQQRQALREWQIDQRLKSEQDEFENAKRLAAIRENREKTIAAQQEALNEFIENDKTEEEVRRIQANLTHFIQNQDVKSLNDAIDLLSKFKFGVADRNTDYKMDTKNTSNKLTYDNNIRINNNKESFIDRAKAEARQKIANVRGGLLQQQDRDSDHFREVAAAAYVMETLEKELNNDLSDDEVHEIMQGLEDLHNRFFNLEEKEEEQPQQDEYKEYADEIAPQHEEEANQPQQQNKEDSVANALGFKNDIKGKKLDIKTDINTNKSEKPMQLSDRQNNGRMSFTGREETIKGRDIDIGGIITEQQKKTDNIIDAMINGEPIDDSIKGSLDRLQNGQIEAINTEDEEGRPISFKYNKDNDSFTGFDEKNIGIIGITRESLEKKLNSGEFTIISEGKAAEIVEDKPTTQNQVEKNKAEAKPVENRIFTDDEFQKRMARLRSAANRIGVNPFADPQIVEDALYCSCYLIESGARKFADYCKKMVESLGENAKAFKDYLAGFYMMAKKDPRLKELGIDKKEFSTEDEVDSFDIDSLFTKPVEEQQKEEPNQEQKENGKGNLLENAIQKAKENAEEAIVKDENNVDFKDAVNKLSEHVGELLTTGQSNTWLLNLLYGRKKVLKDENRLRKLAQELFEGALCKYIRENDLTLEQVLTIYKNQPTLSNRTISQIDFQAYSTPVVLAKALTDLLGIKANDTVLEPTAGNGLLLSSVNPSAKFILNEIQDDRREILQGIFGNVVTDKDALEMDMPKSDFVVTNPPFGKDTPSQDIEMSMLKNGSKTVKYKLTDKAHIIAAKALKNMKADGKAVIIYGAPNGVFGKEDNTRTGGAARFETVLFNYYNVVGAFELGKGMYYKQGTDFPIACVVIDGKRDINHNIYNTTKFSPQRMTSWQQVFDECNNIKQRMAEGVDVLGNKKTSLTAEAQQEEVKKEQPNNTVVEKAKDKSKEAYDGILNRYQMYKDFNKNRKTQAFEEWLNGYIQLLENSNPNANGVKEVLESARLAKEYYEKNIKQKEQQKKEEKPKQQKPEIIKEVKQQAKEKAKKEAEQSSEKLNEELAEGIKEAEAKPVNKVEIKVDVPVGDGKLQTRYEPVSTNRSVNALVPTNLAKAINKALKICREAYGDLTDFVAKMTGNKKAKTSFSAEQIDALALYADKLLNKSAMVCADQTGLGKGRVAAGSIQMSVNNGHIPFFCTEKDVLFSDLYRDLKDIGAHNLRPFFINTDGEMTYVNDEGETVVAYKKIGNDERNEVLGRLEKGDLSDFKGENAKYDFIVGTYTQFQNNSSSSTFKTNAINGLLSKGITDLILDEAHNAASNEEKKEAGQRGKKKKEGEEDTSRYGRFLKFTEKASSILFLSATWAKERGNMSIYSRAIGLSVKQISEQVMQGGQGMIEYLVMDMAMKGKYIRREQSFAGVQYINEVVTKNDEDIDNEIKFSDEHNENVADVINLSIAISNFIKSDEGESLIQELAEEKYGENERYSRADADKKTLSATHGSDSPFSRLFNYVNNLLLSLKADRVADEAIKQIKAGLKPVIALQNTGASQLQSFVNMKGYATGQNIVPMSMADVFEGMMIGRLNHIPLKSSTGQKGLFVDIPFERIPEEIQENFNEIKNNIAKTNLKNLPGTPIDRLIYRIEKAGYSVGEVTGRKIRVRYVNDNEAVFETRPDSPKIRKDTVAKFNNGDIDCVILNESGSTGISLHASENFIDKKQRIMLIAQPFGNINTMMQMLGRIHRVGQVSLPIYKYVMTSLLQEIRIANNLQDKLKSLNANTSSNKEGSQKFSEVDINNTYGQQAIMTWLNNNFDIAEQLGLVGEDDKGNKELRRYDVTSYTGRLSVAQQAIQKDFWETILPDTEALIEEAKARGEDTLTIPSFDDTDAIVVESRKIKGDTVADDYYLKTIDIQIEGKPASIDNAEARALKGESIADNAEAMAELERKGEEFANGTKDRIKNKKNVDIGAIEKRIRSKNSDLLSLIRRIKIGSKMINQWGDLGIVTGVKVKPTKDIKTSNPLINSKVIITMASPSKTGTTIKNAESFYREGWRKIEEGGYNNKDIEDFESSWKARYNDNSSHREQREAITGNLLNAVKTAKQNNLKVSQVQFRTKDGGHRMQFVYLAKSQRSMFSGGINLATERKRLEKITEEDIGIDKQYSASIDGGKAKFRLWNSGALTISFEGIRKGSVAHDIMRESEEYLGRDSWRNNSIFIGRDVVEKANRFLDHAFNYRIIFEEDIDENEKIRRSEEMKNNLPKEFEEDDVHFSISPVWTGSAADYEQPSTQYINSGEGAQVFGWGLYASSREGIGRSYAEADYERKKPKKEFHYKNRRIEELHRLLRKIALLSNPKYKILHRTDLAFGLSKYLASEDNDSNLNLYLEVLNKNAETIIKDNLEEINDIENGEGLLIYETYRVAPEKKEQRISDLKSENEILPKIVKEITEAKNNLKDINEYYKDEEEPNNVHRNLYRQTAFAGKKENLIDWYLPVSKENKEKIQKAVTELMAQKEKENPAEKFYATKYNLRSMMEDDSWTGENVYNFVKNFMVSANKLFSDKVAPAKAASEFLYSIGIDGIKYPINSTRGNRSYDGSFNIVVFNDKDLRVDEHIKWSLAKAGVKAIGTDKLNAIAKKIGNALKQKLGLGLVICKDSAELGNKLREAGAKIKTIPQGAEGCVFNGNVYLVADNIQEGNRVYTVLAHEIAGHVGAEKIYPHFKALMKELLKLENSDEKIKAIFDDVRKNYNDKNDIRIAAEVFAKVMEQVYENENSFTGKIKNLVNFFIKKVKDFFRSLFGMNIPMSASEVYAIANNIMKVTTVKSIMKGEVARTNIYDESKAFEKEPVFSTNNERYEFDQYLEREEAKQNNGSNVVQLSDWETYEKGVEEGKRLGREEKRTADRLAKIARNREKGRQYLAQQEQINKALEEARKPKPATFANKVEAIENWFALKFANKRQRLVQFQEDIEKTIKQKLPDYMNPHRQLDTIDGRIQYKTESFNKKYFKPLYDFLVKHGITYDDFNKFTYAMHADERDKYISEINPTFRENHKRGSGWNDEKMGGTTQEVLNRLYEKYGQDNLMAAGKMFWAMNRAVIDLQEEYGLIDKKTADNIRARYKHYTPLKHIADDEVTTKVVERALGRTSTAQDNLMFATAAIDTTIRWGEKNNAKLAMLNLVNIYKSPMVEINRQKLVQYFNPETGEVEVKLDRSREDNTITARASGVNYNLTFKDEELYKAFVSEQRSSEAWNAIVKTSRVFTNMMGFVSTMANPDFGIANFVRDQSQSGLENITYRGFNFAKNAFKYALPAIKTYIDYRRGIDNEDTRLYKEFLENGGLTGYADMLRLDKRATNLEKSISEDIEANRSILGKLKKLAKNPGDLVHSIFGIFEAFNDSLESATRFGVYKEKRKTSTALEAAELSKNITINFNRHGSLWSSDMNALYLFSNANIQGTRKAWQLLKYAAQSHKGRGIIGSLAAAGFIAEVLGHMFAGFDPDEKVSYYDKLEEWKKDGNLIVFTGGKNYVSVPLSPVVAFPYMIGRNTAAYMFGKKNMSTAMCDIFSNFLTTLNPLGEDSKSLGSLVPTPMRPLVDLWTNKKWNAAKIRPEQNKGLKKPEHQLYFDSKTNKVFVDFAKWLSDVTGGDEYTGGKIDISPADMQYLMENYSGGLGKSLYKGYKLATNQAESLDDIPLARRFYGETNEYSTAKEYKDNQEIADRYSKVKSDRNFDYLKNNKNYIKISNIMKIADKQIDIIRNKKNLSEAEKELAVTKIQKNANTAIRKLQ